MNGPPALLLVGCLACAPAHGVDLPDLEPSVALDPRIWCIQEAANGDLWFGSNGAGAYQYDGRTLVPHAPSENVGRHVRDIGAAPNGDVLLSTNEGVSRFDGERWHALEVETAPDGSGWRLDPQDVWLVVDPGQGGPCRFDGERLWRLRLTESPAEAMVRARHPDSAFPPDGVTTIHRDRSGDVWIGTAAVGLCRYDGRTLDWMYEEALTTTAEGGAFCIRSIYEDRDGDVWICNTRQRFRFQEEGEERDGLRLLRYASEVGLPGAQAEDAEHFTYFPSIAQDRTGTLWMACGSDGVLAYDERGVRHLAVGDEAYVMRVLCDRQGRVWVGTLEQGAWVFDGSGFRPFAARAADENPTSAF